LFSAALECNRTSATQTFDTSIKNHSCLITHVIKCLGKQHRRSNPHSLLQIVLLPDTPLHRRPLGNPIDPLLQVRERLHVIRSETGLLPPFDPRPRLDIGHAVLALAAAGQVLTGFFARVFARELDFEHAVGAQGLLLEALDGVGDFLGGRAREVVGLACEVVVS
jgi:hypothetical protein